MLQTTVVGSYPVPEWLKSMPTPDSLRDALMVAIHSQELAGIDVISDGELGRWDLARNAAGGMVERFVRPMHGVSCDLTRRQLDEFQARATTRYRAQPAGIVVDKLDEGMLNLLHDWRQARALSRAPLKFTVTSPYMLARVVTSTFYKDLEALALAFAEVLAGQVRGIDAEVLQVDEPNLPGTPEDGPLAARAINLVLDATETRRKAVHLCFGNYGGQLIQQGDYGRLIDFINALRCDHVVLETTRRPEHELERLRDIRPEIGLGLGVIDVKDLQIESAEEVARRIEKLAGLVGPGRIVFVHPDCGLRMLPPAVAVGKLRALVAGRDLFLKTGS